MYDPYEEAIEKAYEKLEENQIDLDLEIIEVVNDNFWELLD